MFLIKYAPRHENIWGSGCIASLFLTSALDEGEWSASCPGRFSPGKNAPCTHWIEAGWASESIWTLWGREKSCPYWESNSGRPAGSPSLYRLSYSNSLLLHLRLTYVHWGRSPITVRITVSTDLIHNTLYTDPSSWVAFSFNMNQPVNFVIDISWAVDAGIVLGLGTQPLQSISFTIHYSLIIDGRLYIGSDTAS
jgi:hypothetical protein